MDDFKSIAEEAVQELEKANARIAQLESIAKTAAVRPDGDLVKKAVDGLQKIGLLTDTEGQEACELFTTDPNASLRYIIDSNDRAANAQPTVKKASVNELPSLGRVISETAVSQGTRKISSC